MHQVQLLWRILAIAVQREAAHRTNMVFQALRTGIEVAAGLVTLELVYSRTDTLAGWDAAEATVVLGLFTTMSGLLQAFVEPNLAFFSTSVVREGKLDDLLLQPVPSMLLASLGTCQPWALAQVALGLVVTMLGLARGNSPLGPTEVLSGLILLAAGALIMWSTRVLVASLAFWAPHVEVDVLYGAFWQLGRYPVDIYPTLLGVILRSAIPVAFIATVPARALTHTAEPFMVVAGTVLAASAVLTTRLVWQAGLRRYTSATS
jgi:ABC-2 type transport system permease protein